MTKVSVFNRKNACKLAPMPDTVVISITRPGDPAPLDWGWQDILRLEFDDITWEDTDPNEKGFPIHGTDRRSFVKPKLVLFSEAQAAQVIEFAEKFQEKSFMVHCDAGISRSVAIGFFIASTFEKELVLNETDTIQFRNVHVDALLRRAINKRFYGDSIKYKGE